jgi:hypothetical protein
MKNIFISYSWDSDEHIAWVNKLADDLEAYKEINVHWDGYDLDSLVDKNHFMEKINTADIVLVVSTKKYKNKCDNRKGGVGIETYLSTSRHWESLLSTGQSGIINIIREKDSTPTYLKGHFYIDATLDTSYNPMLETIISYTKGDSKVKRPQKTRSIEDKSFSCNLTKTAEIIALSAKNRREIVSVQNGTDYSGNKKIKFELWETNTPATNYIIALHDNINISQTLESAAESINSIVKQSKSSKIQSIITLRIKDKSKNSPSIKIILESNYGLDTASITFEDIIYSDFIWKYCIDGDFKTSNRPDIIEFYTPQDLQNEEGIISEPAADYITRQLTKNSTKSGWMIVGGGGIGKTSLCISIAAKICSTLGHQTKHMLIFIKAEDIRKYVTSSGTNLENIKTVYDFYEIQSKFLNQNNILDRKSFELALISGNIILIIDGLDELATISRGSFSINEFIESISLLHKELGSTHILITSREDRSFNEINFDALGIAKYNLLGFTEESCRKYLSKRFYHFEEKEKITDKIVDLIKGSKLSESDRIVPFFIDIISNEYEESISQSMSDFSIFESNTPYKSLNEMTDKVIFAVFEREKVRHKFHISAHEMVDTFILLNNETENEWSYSSVKSTLQILYDQNSDEIMKSITVSPLLRASGEKIQFKYDFLRSYFKYLYFIDTLIKQRVDNEFIKELSKIDSSSPEFVDTSSYFRRGHDSIVEIASKVIPKLLEQIKQSETNTNLAKKIHLCIECLITLTLDVVKMKRLEFTSFIKEIFKGHNGRIQKLFIKGDLPPLDFSDLTISDSRFKSYQKFLESDFNENTKFINCEFIECDNIWIEKSKFLRQNIDSASCKIGDLNEYFSRQNTYETESQETNWQEINYFLSSFYRGSAFRENNKTHIYFSKKTKGLNSTKLTKILRSGFICIAKEKEVDTFYGVADHFKPSVRKFLNDGVKDGKMKEFYGLIVSMS